MKLYIPAVFLVVASSCHGFSTSSMRHQQQKRIFTLGSSQTDAAFSAFADSLEEEPEEATVVEKPWQAKLEDLMDPKTDLAERQILLSELMNANGEIQESVMDALAKRKLDPLLTPTAARLQDGTRAVVRQIANDILPQLGRGPQPPSPKALEKVGNRLFNAFTNQMQKNMQDFQQDLSDPINRIPQRLTKQTEDLAKEVKNVFLETPEGLQEPPYKVVENCNLYEVRDYEAYTVASTTMGEGEDIATAGTAFNTLAAYLFGANKDSKSMAMTTPVTTSSLGEMRFFLAENVIPEPLESLDTPVDILDVPAARLAVRKFAGFATDGEIARQKDTLLQALEMDGVELDVAHGAVVPHVVFQYNPPYTLPIVRRNEIAVPIRRPEEVQTSLKEEWSVEDEEGPDNYMDDLAPSD